MQNIYLIGFMGSGKSSIGIRLAQKWQRPFLDLDQQITQNTGQSISSLFADYGEAYFRKLEADTLHKTAALNSTIIALGGGTPCFFDNMSWLNAHGKTIYLYTSPPILAQRLMPERATRPLIAHIDNLPALTDFIEQKLAERSPFYQQATHVLNTDKLIIDDIINKLNSII